MRKVLLKATRLAFFTRCVGLSFGTSNQWPVLGAVNENEKVALFVATDSQGN